ncbi:MAG: ATP-binding cassette domain-containing protein [Agathobacter sp.]|nr:ATP-binding cassette domain-containing protein [Agathobacter sp.]
MTEIEVKNLCKTINKNMVLDNINLHMVSGQVYGFQGINGSGKTMFMRALIGLIHPTSGMILIDQKELGKDMDFPKSIGFLLENPTFLDMYSGPDNLRLLAGVDNNISADMINKEIDSLIEEVGLKSAENKKYKKYSLGMKQRLGIAAAVLGNPDIVVLDEPTNALDDDGKDMVKRIVKMQKERGALVIISCHEMQTLEELSDEIIRLREGRICEREKGH